MNITTRRLAVHESKLRQGVAARIGEVARQLDRGADTAGRVMLVNEALFIFIDQLYYFDGDRFTHIDPVTWQILPACPWGAKGWKNSGLRRHEARILSKILMARIGYKALFYYTDQDQVWHVDLQLYPGWIKACSYLVQNPITADEWAKVA